MTTFQACRSCEARIVWTITEQHKRMPIDWQPDPQGIVAAYQDELGGWHSRHAAPGEPVIAPWKRYTSHFATCPNADQHRQPTDAQRAAAQDVRDELAAWRAKKAKQSAAAGQSGMFTIPPPADRNSRR